MESSNLLGSNLLHITPETLSQKNHLLNGLPDFHFLCCGETSFYRVVTLRWVQTYFALDLCLFDGAPSRPSLLSMTQYLCWCLNSK